jgi:hypothetical protein
VKRFTLVPVVLVLLLAVSAPTTAAPQKRVLQGTVGPGFTISLKQNGQKVTKLMHGTYTLVVSDKSSIHNFVVERSGGSERAVTSVPFTGRKTATFTFRKGKYEFYCKPHESIMHGEFRVT